MNYNDYLVGIKEDNFWHISKTEFIDIMFSRLKTDNMKILNAGCGTGNDLKIFKKYGKVCVIDINKKALVKINDNQIIKKQGDICNLKFPDNYFDVVTLFDVVEHIQNDRVALNECKRVLKKDGFLLLTVPAFQIIFGSHDIFLGHKRRYTKKRVLSLLNDLLIKEIGYWNCFLFFPIFIDRFFNRKFNHKKYLIHNNLNKILSIIMKFENFLIRKRLKMPIGISIYCIARKK